MKSNSSRALSLTAVLLLVACGESSLLGPDAPQGIDGVALLGPLCPVEREDEPCPDRPLQDATIRVRRQSSGGTFATLSTDADGRFRVGLEPGDYTLVPEPGDPFPVASEQDVTVAPGVWIEVTVSFDTGIRAPVPPLR